ncbi:MAG TPA: glycine betaine ABC transporter substrate-binding protein [Pseudonocardia sp.]|nr:glycine betaine ABC transporter substrate-binding protein [Pseudonocardia sp.]
MRTRILGSLLAALIAVGLAACGTGGMGRPAGTGSLRAFNLTGAEFTVGSKEFTESLVLGQITIRALQAVGAKVHDETGIQGTSNVRIALTSGQIDMYWDYTGTGWTTLLGHTPDQAPKDSAALFQAVQSEDLRKNQVRWLPPAPLNNTYAIAAARANAQRLGVRTLSDYARLAGTNPAQASMCIASEFLTRDDGWPGVEKTYGFTLPPTYIQVLDAGVIYTQIPTGQRCVFGEVTASDARVASNQLQVLQDDKHTFVLYNAALTIRDDVYRRYPQLAAIFAPISAKLTDDVVRQLNLRVDIAGDLPEQVAQDFLLRNGFIS